MPTYRRLRSFTGSGQVNRPCRSGSSGLQILTTEASLPQNLQDQLAGEFHALAVRGLVFDVTDNAFRLVQGIQGGLRGANIVRCPAS